MGVAWRPPLGGHIFNSFSFFFIFNGLFPRGASVLLLEPVFSSKQTRVILFVFRVAGEFSAQTKAVSVWHWLKRCGGRSWEAQSVCAHHTVPLSSVLAAGAADGSSTQSLGLVPQCGVPERSQMAGGRSITPNSPLTRVCAFALGGIWETGEEFQSLETRPFY